MESLGIGARIKILRQDMGMTQTELAKCINSTKQAVYKYENNIVTNIPLEKIKLIAEALGTSPDYLVGWTGAQTLQKWIDFNSFPLEKIEKISKFQLLERFHELNTENQLKLLDYANNLRFSQEEEHNNEENE